MTLTPLIGPGTNPFTNAVEENADEKNSRFTWAQGGRRSLAGMTRAERVAAGCGSAADLAEAEADNAAHREWLASAAGRKFLARTGLTR